MKINWLNHFIELIIVIIGISSAFWLNNMAVENRERQLKNVFLQEIRDDLKKDIKMLENISNLNNEKLEKMSEGLDLINNRSSPESILPYIFQLGNYNFFIPEDLTLRSLLQSGDFKTIDSRDIKKEILRLLRIHENIDEAQQNFLSALDQNYFPILIEYVDMSTGELVDKEFVYDIRVKNYFAYTFNETSNGLAWYKGVDRQTRKIIDLIDEIIVE